jgi:hypothetical protein
MLKSSDYKARHHKGSIYQKKEEPMDEIYIRDPERKI